MKYREFEGNPVELIEQNLQAIENNEGVRILRAVESGSRAWGFASPDSDFDVRFIYVRPASYYLSLRPGKKDTIEWIVDETLDICGWDISKALGLARKSNVYFFEWAGSPVVYRNTSNWAMAWAVGQRYFSCKAAIHSYHSIAMKTEREFLRGERVRYKKYLYAVRPLLACKFIEEQNTWPPVEFAKLVCEAADYDLKPAIDLLLERKVNMREKEEDERIPEIDEFVAWGLEHYGKLAALLENDRVGSWEPIDQVFMGVLELQ